MAVVVFIAFWVLVAVGLVFVSLRGGPRGARDALQSQARGARRFTTAAIAVVCVVFGLILPGVLLAGNGEDVKHKYKSLELTSAEQSGRDVFYKNCASCHTLKAAGSEGKVGPNLDDLKPPKSLLLDALEKGRQRGQGTMPARLVTGTDATDVSSFVAKVAGR
jgi:mono/diheme cytochrome c family protein